MADRANSGVRVPNVAAPVSGGDITSFVKFVTGLRILRGQLVTFTFAAGTAVVERHGLGRRYLGGFIVSQTAQHTQSISVIDPATFEGSGYNPDTHVGMQAGGSGGATYTGTVVAWCF